MNNSMDLNARLAVAFGRKPDLSDSQSTNDSSKGEELSSLTEQFIGLLSQPSKMKDGHTFKTNEQAGLPPFHFRIKWNVCKYSNEKSLVVESSPNPSFTPKLVTQGRLFTILSGLIKQWRKSEVKKEIQSLEQTRQEEISPAETKEIAEEKTFEIVEKVGRVGSTSPEKSPINVGPTKSMFNVLQSSKFQKNSNSKALQILDVIDQIDPGFIPPRTLIRSFDWGKLYSSDYFRVLRGLNFELQQLGCDSEDLRVLSALAQPEKEPFVFIPQGYPFTASYIAKELLAFLVSWCQEYLDTSKLTRRSKRRALLVNEETVFHSRILLSYYLLVKLLENKIDDLNDLDLTGLDMASAIDKIVDPQVIEPGPTTKYLKELWFNDKLDHVLSCLLKATKLDPVREKFFIVDDFQRILDEAERRFRITSMLVNQIDEMSD